MARTAGLPAAPGAAPGSEPVSVPVSEPVSVPAQRFQVFRQSFFPFPAVSPGSGAEDLLSFSNPIIIRAMQFACRQALNVIFSDYTCVKVTVLVQSNLIILNHYLKIIVNQIAHPF